MTNLISIFLFVDQYHVGIYAICAAGLLAVWGWLLRPAHRDLSRAQFELEREIALNRRARGIDFAGLLLLIILAVTAIDRVVVPYLDANPDDNPLNRNQFGLASYREQFVTRVPGIDAQAESGATPDPQSIMANTGNGSMGGAAAALPPSSAFRTATDIFSGDVEATHTPTATPPGTLMPLVDIPPVVGCTDDSARITLPVNGQVLSENVVVQGSAYTEGFSSYKFELKGPETGDVWAVLRTYTTQVDNGVLGQFDGSAFLPGLYQFRLAVVDHEDSTIASCMITVQIRAPFPTPTPIRYN